MSTDTWIQKEKERLTEDIEGIRSDIDRLINGEILEDALPRLIQDKVISQQDIKKFRQRTLDTCNDIKYTIKKLMEAEQDQEKRRSAFAAISSVAVLDSEVAWLTSHMEGLRQAIMHISQKAIKVLNWLINHLKPIIQRISTRLWQLISSLMTPKSWTVQGDAGVNLFGLKGSVGISITFGS